MQAPNQSISRLGHSLCCPVPLRGSLGLRYGAPLAISRESRIASPTGGRGEGERVEKFEYALFPITHLKSNIERSGITLIRPGKLEDELVASFSKYAIFLISRSE